jgi:hypothetical protein
VAEPAADDEARIPSYARPHLVPGASFTVRWSAGAESIDPDSEKTTKRRSSGKVGCRTSEDAGVVSLECDGIAVDSPYEIALPTGFSVGGGALSTSDGWSFPLEQRSMQRAKVGRMEGGFGILRLEVGQRDGELWCSRRREGVAHETTERLCFHASGGGLASYTISLGSAAVTADVAFTFGPVDNQK